MVDINFCAGGIPRILPKLAILVVVTLLNACSNVSNAPVTDKSYQQWTKRQQALEDIDAWEIQARAAIFVKQEVHQVGFSWVHKLEHFSIMIRAPFGKGVFRVESNASVDRDAAVKLTMPDGQRHFSGSTEALLSRLFGWTIPIAGLKSWIKGAPQPSETYSYELYGDGRLKSLQQQNWRINYLDYFAEDDTEAGLPRKMYLKHPDLALKIVIDRWQPLEARMEAPAIFPDFD